METTTIISTSVETSAYTETTVTDNYLKNISDNSNNSIIIGLALIMIISVLIGLSLVKIGCGSKWLIIFLN